MGLEDVVAQAVDLFCRALAQVVGCQVRADAPAQHTMQFDRADVARCEVQLETGGRCWQAADLNQYTFERNVADPQAGLGVSIGSRHARSMGPSS